MYISPTLPVDAKKVLENHGNFNVKGPHPTKERGHKVVSAIGTDPHEQGSWESISLVAGRSLFLGSQGDNPLWMQPLLLFTSTPHQ